MESMQTISASSRGASSKARPLLPEPVGPVRIRTSSNTSGLMPTITAHRGRLAKSSRSESVPTFTVRERFPFTLRVLFDFFLRPANVVAVAPLELHLTLLEAQEVVEVGSRV